MRGINHPSIVKLLSFSESTEYYFLVLERASPLYSVTIAICQLYFSDGGWRAIPPNCQTYVF